MPSKSSIALLSAAGDAASGWGMFTQELSRRLARRYDVTLYLPQVAERAGDDWPCRIIRCLPAQSWRWRHPRALLQYAWPRIPVNGARLVHSLTDFPYCLPAAAIARRQRVPLVISLHATHAVKPLASWPGGYWLRRAYQTAAHVTAPSRFTADRVRKALGHELPVTVIPNGVDAARFAHAPDVADLRARYGPGPILLTVGSLKTRKGQDVALRAFAEVKRQLPQAVYLLIGADRSRGALQRLAQTLQVPDVHFLGPISGEALVRYYHLCDVFVLTARVADGAFEGYPLVCVEAAAAAKPVVGSQAGGVPEAVVDGVTGLIAPEGDVPATAAAMLRLLRDPALAQRLGAAGRLRAQAQDWDRYVERLDAIYGALLR